VEQYRDPLTQGFKSIKRAAIRATDISRHTVQRIRCFMRVCRKVPKFLIRNPSTHKPLSNTVIPRIELHLQKIMAVLNKSVHSKLKVSEPV
jgi:hypothetical protein